jgi:predicted negative regulator of RcsB-dependent stress response
MFQKTDHRQALAAAQQFVLAAEQCSTELRSDLLRHAVETLEEAMTRSDRQSLIVAAIGAHVRLASVTGDEAQWNRAIELAKEITQRDPHGIGSWRNLGDVLWAAGRGKEAAAAYERALQNDASFELDELKQLSNRDRQLIRDRTEGPRKPSQEAHSP